MHLHEDGKQVQSEEDLGGPAPISDERVGTPESQPEDLVQTLDRHAEFAPAQNALVGHE